MDRETDAVFTQEGLNLGKGRLVQAMVQMSLESILLWDGSQSRKNQDIMMRSRGRKTDGRLVVARSMKEGLKHSCVMYTGFP